jgi:hypothetical protein
VPLWDWLRKRLAEPAGQRLTCREGYRMPKRYKDVIQHRTVLTGLPVGRPANPGRIVSTSLSSALIHGEP